MKRPPIAFVATIAALVVLSVFVGLVSFGVPPFDNVAVFILSQVAGAFTLLVFGVIGGAFVGMLLAHRILANREFTPFERTVLESLADLRARLDRLERDRARGGDARQEPEVVRPGQR